MTSLTSNDTKKKINTFIISGGTATGKTTILNSLIISLIIYIEAGLVQVNEKYITQMGFRVSENDIVKFNGRKLKSEKKQYILLNKPKNFSCRLDDFGKKNSVFELIKNTCKEKVLPVTKLNKKSSGLVLFTNDEKLSSKH